MFTCFYISFVGFDVCCLYLFLFDLWAPCWWVTLYICRKQKSRPSRNVLGHRALLWATRLWLLARPCPVTLLSSVGESCFRPLHFFVRQIDFFDSKSSWDDDVVFKNCAKNITTKVSAVCVQPFLFLPSWPDSILTRRPVCVIWGTATFHQ